MYKNFIETHEEYEKIFVTDTRDVIFQGDLFSSYTEYKNFLVYATEGQLIKNDKFFNNQNWLKHLVGEIEYQKIKDNPAVCCGTVYGTCAELNILIENIVKFITPKSNWGDDQAVLNYLVHNKLLPIENLIESDVNTGKILTTIQTIDFNKNTFNDFILNNSGGVPAVVHQYDRHAELIQLVDKLYREKDFQPDENFTDVQSALDQVFCLVQRQNFSAATKFFINHVAYAENLNLYGEKFLKLVRLILQRYNPDAEILLSAVQKILVNIFSKNITVLQLENLYRIFIIAEKNLHCVNPSFKNFVKNALEAFVDIFYRNNQHDWAKEYIKRLTDWRD